MKNAAIVKVEYNKIQAIKLVREYTGAGLRECKGVVEALLECTGDGSVNIMTRATCDRGFVHEEVLSVRAVGNLMSELAVGSIIPS